MPFPEIDPIAFSLGPIVVRWYSLAYLVGVLLAALYGLSLIKNKRLWINNTPALKREEWLDFGFWAVLGIIIGGRLGYVLFYNPLYYLSNPFEILQTWNGGMSFHGGMIGVALAMILFARAKKTNILSSLDLLAVGAPLGLFLGRIANFINGELFGRETGLPWGVIFPMGGDVARHPSQLYEAALEGIVLFLLIRYFTHIVYALRKPGFIAGIFGLGYGISRILVETVRLPDMDKDYLYGGWLTYGMVLTLPMVVGGITLIIYANRKKKLVK